MRFGFSKLGPVSLMDSANEVFIGKNLMQNRSVIAQSTSKVIDHEVRKMANDALRKAIEILSPMTFLIGVNT